MASSHSTASLQLLPQEKNWSTFVSWLSQQTCWGACSNEKQPNGPQVNPDETTQSVEAPVVASNSATHPSAELKQPPQLQLSEVKSKQASSAGTGGPLRP